MAYYGSGQQSRVRQMALDPDQVAGMQGRLGQLPALMQQRETARQQKIDEQRFQQELAEQKKRRKMEEKQSKQTTLISGIGTIGSLALGKTGRGLLGGLWNKLGSGSSLFSGTGHFANIGKFLPALGWGGAGAGVGYLAGGKKGALIGGGAGLGLGLLKGFLA